MKAISSDSSHWRLAALTLATLVMLSLPSCGDDFAPASEIATLRIISVKADKPYAAPGDEVTFSLTFHDGIPEGPRPVEVIWIGPVYSVPLGRGRTCRKGSLPLSV